MKKLTFLIIACSFSAFAFAYPITPRPLRKLVMESELIVWAYVADIGTGQSKNKQVPDGDRDYATLVIKELLQGKLTTDTIQVWFSSGLICPQPGVFFKGETVLAFLDKRGKKGAYKVHALSYGVKHDLSTQDFAIYKKRIGEMQDMIRSGEAANCSECVMEWLTKCAEQKCTRWEGTYELSPHSDFMSYYDQDEQTGKEFLLTNAQRKRLFDALMALDSMDYVDIALVDMVKGMNDPLLFDLLKSALAKLQEDNFWPARDIMTRIVELTGNTELEKLADEFNDVYFDVSDSGRDKQKKILSDFITKMKTVELKKTVRAFGDGNA